jgi:hypothetical protein
MIGFDPRTAVPCKWSLKPEDVFGLIFWTRQPTNLIRDAEWLKDYPLVVHFTLTGWEEVEHKAPGIKAGLELMTGLVKTFGPERVNWRFSPVPAVPDVLERFEVIASVAAGLGLPSVYVAFLQENDLLPETRPKKVRQEILKQMAAKSHGLEILLCADDQTLLRPDSLGFPMASRVWPGGSNLRLGVCESGGRFNTLRREKTHGMLGPGPAEQFTVQDFDTCGCCLAVDPFTINETCNVGCLYCYAADKSLAPKKRNTTKGHLPIIGG